VLAHALSTTHTPPPPHQPPLPPAHKRFTAAKRFGLEGCETLIPGMKALIDRVTDLGVESIVMGMPHRGAWCVGGRGGRVERGVM